MNILDLIIEKRRADIACRGLDFGFPIPIKRSRPVHPFLQEKGVILEVKRASPSKGDISPELDSYATALSYAQSGARAISCLTEENFFKGSLEDLMKVCHAADDFEASGKSAPAVLRKDFLLSADEVEIAFRAGADAVLLIARILPAETFLQMAKTVNSLGMSALVEVRAEEDLQKLAFVFAEENHLDKSRFVFGVNSRDLATFKIDLLRPAMMTEKIRSVVGSNARIVFESGVTTPECASSVGAMGFSGLLLGEAAAKNPDMRKSFVDSFLGAKETKNSQVWQEYAYKLAESSRNSSPKVKICGLTRIEDALAAQKYGAAFLGFVFAEAFPRSVTKEDRLAKILPRLGELKAKKVAVIVDVSSPESQKAIDLVREGTFDLIQFHNIPYEKIASEEPEIFELPHYFAVKTFEEYEKLLSLGEMRLLFDSKELLHGKSSSEAAVKKQVYESKWLAGGITPENAASLVRQFSPELIDVSGGVEDEGQIGIKNHEKIQELLKNVR